MYEIHASEETAQIILGTGMYQEDEIKKHNSAVNGGIAQLAAIVAGQQCSAAILFLDPNDPWSDAVENRALIRVCIRRRVRLITTYAAALRWATYEASAFDELKEPPHASWLRKNWQDGISNARNSDEHNLLPIEQRSIALISHDKMKLEMVDFLNNQDHLALLAKHHRILATGTTGWVLKLLFSSNPHKFDPDIHELGSKEHLISTMVKMLDELQVKTKGHEEFDRLLEMLGAKLETTHCDEFADKVLPLPSGPDGGDVMAADEVLCNKCHAIIFFHDPLSPHPHNDDIRLLERTSRLHGVFSECVSDRQSAEHWINGLKRESASPNQFPSIAELLRKKYRLNEVILAETDDNIDSIPLGTILARTCAGFVNQYIQNAGRENKDIRIGVTWGWGMRQVLIELTKMKNEGVLTKPTELPHKLLWSPIIGILTAEINDWEANMIAEGFRLFYDGQCEQLGCAGFSPKGAIMPQNVKQFIETLQTANLVLTTASAWNASASLANCTGLDLNKMPSFERAVGNISGVFLNPAGKEVTGKYTVVGLGRAGFQQVRKTGNVVLMCGGNNRNRVILSALRANLVSVLITTRLTAEWILSED